MFQFKSINAFPNHKILIKDFIYVDQKYGFDNTRQKSTPNRPYKTINFAISSLNNQQLDQTHQYIIYVSPGIYDEIIILRPFVNIAGSGKNLTRILGCHAKSSGSVSNLTISNIELPLIDITLNNSQIDENYFLLENINIQAHGYSDSYGKPVISVSANGINNSTLMSNIDLQISIFPMNENKSIPNQTLFNLSGCTSLTNIRVKQIASYQSGIIMIDALNIIDINSCVFELRLNDSPSQEVTIINANRCTLNVNNSSFIAEILPIKHSYMADINFIKSNSRDNIIINTSVINFDSVDINYNNLVCCLNENACIQLLGLVSTTPAINKIKGHKKCVKYVAFSGNGSVNCNGGTYSNITKINQQDNPGGYFVQENDHTILTDSCNVYIFDPKFANSLVIDVGKILVIKNIGKKIITIYSENNTIFDEDHILLNALQTVTLQNDGNVWYIL